MGLSLGSAEGIDGRHLARLRGLVERLAPALVSEHLSWSIAGGAYLNHLLPLPYDDETLGLLARHVERAQEALGRRLLVENPSSYLRFRHSPIAEPSSWRAGPADRLRDPVDVNNVYVTCRNFGLDPMAYLEALPPEAVGEIHLAGHSANDADGQPVLIDDHGSRVAEPVWDLYAQALRRFGPVPTLVEWDTELPALAVLLDEARTAQRRLDAATDDVRVA